MHPRHHICSPVIFGKRFPSDSRLSDHGKQTVDQNSNGKNENYSCRGANKSYEIND